MNKICAAPQIGFADSEYKSFQMNEDKSLIINMNNWQMEPLKLIFLNIIQFSYRLGDVPKDLYVLLDSTPFLQEALSLEYTTIPSIHPYKLFQLEDIYDFPFIQVVAESVTVIKDNL